MYCRYVQLTYHSSIVPFLPLQTRTLCSAMRRQMAIQLFIARMGSWIWQDIHARKLCKRVRTDRRTDRRTQGQLNTSILIWMYLYILFNCLPTTTTLKTTSRTGCSCHFLYGPDTKEEHKQQIEKSLSNKMELKLEVIFYKKEGKMPVKFCANIGAEVCEKLCSKLFSFLIKKCSAETSFHIGAICVQQRGN